ncbi:MAG: radical SAM protein [Eubacteriales bacterium]
MAENYCFHSKKINEFIDENFKDIRAPFTAGFELTAKCNLDCVHCYAKPSRKNQDMTLEEFKTVFDAMLERGLLDVYLTGGEIFTRQDFREIYLHAKSKGVLVSLLSNITLLDEEKVALLLDYPVEVISTTMYGHSEESYEKVTGVKGSYKKFMQALELLEKNSIRYELKYVAMQQNFEEVYKMREFGKKLGAPMIILLDVHPMSDGSTDPLQYRITPDEAFQFDIKDEGRRNFWKDVAKDLLSGEINTRPLRTVERFNQGLLYPCSIANQHTFITSDLKMQGCVRASYRQYDLRKGTFDEGWEYLQKEFIEKKSSPEYKCNNCQNIRFCEHCVANFMLLNGDEEKVDTFFCEVASLRKSFVDSEIKNLLTAQHC